MDPQSYRTPDLTPYHYVRNNPINRFDPDGRADFLKTLFGISSSEPTNSNQVNYAAAIDNIHNTAKELNGEIATTIDQVTSPVAEPINAGLEAAKEPTIAITAVVAPIAETTGNGLLIAAAFAGPAAPEILAAAGTCQAISTGCKILNKVAGGNDFTTTDIASDVAATFILGGKQAKTAIKKTAKAFEQKIVDTSIDVTVEAIKAVE